MAKKEHLILIGYMGCGKSTMGVRLSYKLRMTMVDTDTMIERMEHRSITEIFAQEGEEYFRSVETAVLEKLERERIPQIISLGGGTPLREENREILKRLGHVVYLKASPETIFQRVKGDTTRPLLQCEDPQAKIREMLEYRSPLYEMAADSIVEVDGLNTTDVLEKILEVYNR